VDLVCAVESYGIREEPSVKAVMATIKQGAMKVQEKQSKINKGYSDVIQQAMVEFGLDSVMIGA
jgi:hypothetical protein